MAPWPPGPVSVMRSEWASDMAMPSRRATKPVGSCEVTWKPTSRAPVHGRRARRLRPSSWRRTSASSAGLEEEDVAAREGPRGAPPAREATPSSEATCTSWPQACMTPSTSEWPRRACVLLHGQRVDIGPQDDGAPGPAAVEGEDAAGLGDPARLGDAEGRHVVADHARSCACSSKASSGWRCTARRRSTMSSKTASAGAAPALRPDAGRAHPLSGSGGRGRCG